MDQSPMEICHEPLVIFREVLIPLMTSAGFELQFDCSDDKRYHTGFIWRKSFVDTDLLSDTYGTTQLTEMRVDVIGIPIGSSFLILHGILIGARVDDYTDVKLKIRCLPRKNSLVDAYNNTNQSYFMRYINDNDDKSVSCHNYRDMIRLTIESEFVYKLIELVSLKLEELPFELKLKILSYLPLNSIGAMSRVSTSFREIALDEQLWKLLVKKYFPDIYDRRVNGQSWKALFKTEFRRERLLMKRQNFAHRHDVLLALPASPPLLPILAPPYFPMLPPPPAYIRDIFSYPLGNHF